MTAIINRDSFELEGANVHDQDAEYGTVEVTLGRETRRLKANRRGVKITVHSQGQIFGRYRTGKKNWPAVLFSNMTPEGKVLESCLYGNDDRSGRCQINNSVFFV